MVTVIA
jgi:hypothetical protein